MPASYTDLPSLHFAIPTQRTLHTRIPSSVIYVLPSLVGFPPCMYALSYRLYRSLAHSNLRRTIYVPSCYLLRHQSARAYVPLVDRHGCEAVGITGTPQPFHLAHSFLHFSLPIWQRNGYLLRFILSAFFLFLNSRFPTQPVVGSHLDALPGGFTPCRTWTDPSSIACLLPVRFGRFPSASELYTMSTRLRVLTHLHYRLL